MNAQICPPLFHCLQQRAAHFGHPPTWEWVLRDEVVACFAPALPYLEDEGLIELTNPLRRTCQDLYWHTAAYWVRREHHLKRLLSALKDAHIPVIPLKGAALLENLYPNIGLRSLVDVDILVRQADFTATAEIFLAHGLQPNWGYESGNLFEFRRLPEPFWPGELSFVGQGGLHIDVHHDLVTYHWFKAGYPVDITGVWERSLQLTHRENPLWDRRLSPYDMLGHLCLHLALHGLQIVKNLFDIDQFLRNLAGDWDWEHFLNLTNAWGLRSAAYHVFVFSQAFFLTPIPEDVMQALTPAPFDRWLLKRLITPQALFTTRTTLGVRYPSLVKFALFDGVKIKAESMLNLLFPPPSLRNQNPAYQGLLKHWGHLFTVIRRGD